MLESHKYMFSLKKPHRPRCDNREMGYEGRHKTLEARPNPAQSLTTNTIDEHCCGRTIMILMIICYANYDEKSWNAFVHDATNSLLYFQLQ